VRRLRGQALRATGIERATQQVAVILAENAQWAGQAD
jgi:hypothetical protein